MAPFIQGMHNKIPWKNRRKIHDAHVRYLKDLFAHVSPKKRLANSLKMSDNQAVQSHQTCWITSWANGTFWTTALDPGNKAFKKNALRTMGSRWFIFPLDKNEGLIFPWGGVGFWGGVPFLDLHVMFIIKTTTASLRKGSLMWPVAYGGNLLFDCPPWNMAPWGWVVGRWISFWNGLFSTALLVLGRVSKKNQRCYSSVLYSIQWTQST